MTSTPSRLAIGWGAAWGVALGSWALAPRLLDFCRLHPASWIGWLQLDLVLSLVFAILGATIAFFACAPLVLVEAARGRLRERSAAYGLALPVLLPLTYLGLILLIDAFTRGPLRRTDPYPELFSAALALAAAAPLLAFAYHRRLRTRVIRGVVAGVAAIGFLLLPLHAPPSVPAVSATSVELRRAGTASAPPSPLLFIGIDSANWRTLRPLLERDSLPTLQRLKDSGLHGSIAALWPPYWSAPAWAAILTGWGRGETGIYEDLALEIPGLPAFEIPLRLDFALQPLIVSTILLAQTKLIQLAPARRQMLGRPPFWELVSRAGVKTAVVRLPFTYPANGEADYVISDRVGEELWGWLGMHAESGPGAVWPPGESAALLAPFAGPLRAKEFAGIPSGASDGAAPDAHVDPLAVLERAAKLDERTVSATERLVRDHPDVSVVAVYLGGFDTICHAFWQYRFPEDYPDDAPSAEAVAALGDVVDRYWKFLDRSIGEMIAAFPREPNVVVVADHGAERNQDNLLWRGWHAATGAIFLAAGPGVPPHGEELRVSYFDVVPTLLALAGFEKPAELTGRSLVR